MEEHFATGTPQVAKRRRLTKNFYAHKSEMHDLAKKCYVNVFVSKARRNRQRASDIYSLVNCQYLQTKLRSARLCLAMHLASDGNPFVLVAPNVARAPSRMALIKAQLARLVSTLEEKVRQREDDRRDTYGPSPVAMCEGKFH
jgi:predicted nucleotidyltransferase